MAHQVDNEPKRVSVWLDVLIAIWLAVAASAFIVKLLVDTRTAPEWMMTVVAAGEYAYALVLVACVAACGLALARGLVRNR